MRRMSAITLMNAVDFSNAPMAEFHVLNGKREIAHVGVAALGSATIPTTTAARNSEPVVGMTAEEWSAYAIINGITTPVVKTSNANARLTLTAWDDGGYRIVVA
jgi:hypothetical protein